VQYMLRAHYNEAACTSAEGRRSVSQIVISGGNEMLGWALKKDYLTTFTYRQRTASADGMTSFFHRLRRIPAFNHCRRAGYR
jgi:hypothetical protein